MLDFILESSSIILYRGLGTSPRLMASAGISGIFFFQWSVEFIL